MSKPTETTNDRVPRDIVRIGTTVGKHTETHGSTRKRGEAHGWLDEVLPKRAETWGGWPKRAERSEREDAGRGVKVDFLVLLI